MRPVHRVMDKPAPCRRETLLWLLSAQAHQLVIGRPRVLKELRVGSELVHDPISHGRTISAASAGQIEDKVRALVEPVLAANGLNVVAVERAAAEARVELAQQILLPPRIEAIDILRLQESKITDHWVVVDQLQLMSQLGAL